MPTTVEFRRITNGPSLVIEDAAQLALDFFRTDASSAPGGYDDQAGRGEPYHVTSADIIAINTTMRARSPHAAWQTLTAATDAQHWLRAINPDWDLVSLDDDTWLTRARSAVEDGLAATLGRGRGLSVATKVLHLKRPPHVPGAGQPGPPAARGYRERPADEGHRTSAYRRQAQHEGIAQRPAHVEFPLRSLHSADHGCAAVGEPPCGRIGASSARLAARGSSGSNTTVTPPATSSLLFGLYEPCDRVSSSNVSAADRSSGRRTRYRMP